MLLRNIIFIENIIDCIPMIRVSYSIALILSALHSSTLLQERDVEDVSGWARSDIVKLASILT